MVIKRSFTKTVLASKLNDEIQASTFATIFNGLSFDADNQVVTVYFTEEPSSSQDVELNTMIINHVPTPTFHSTMVNYLSKDVYEFVKTLRLDFAADNIEMGVTQAGKTKTVADQLRDLNYYLDVFSLYEAVGEIDRMIATGFDPADAPFITESRMNEFKTKILQFLGVV